MNDLEEIALAATRLVAGLPHGVAVSLAEEVARHGGTDWPSAKAAILLAVPTPHFRDAAADFLDLWRTRANGMTPEAVAAALVTAARAENDHRQHETVEIVWTGPESNETRFRRTEQAILEVLNSARERLTVVSFAVYRIPQIRDALVAAANRGVTIRLVVETPNRAEGQSEYNSLLALGRNVASVASVYYWPHEKRGRDEQGRRVGSLHVKCAVADEHRLFLSSANLTDYAFTINMELGLLVTGGKLPGQVERHFERLIASGHLAGV